MQQTYLCPNCRAQVSDAERYCGYCGFNLTPRPQRMLSASRLPSAYNKYSAQSTSAVSWPLYTQQKLSEVQPEGHGRTSSLPAGDTVKPIHSEIIKLLDEVFGKQKTS